MKRAVTLLSGGLDSTTLLYVLVERGYEVLALSIDYGQRHGMRELAAAALVFDAMSARFTQQAGHFHQHKVVSLGPMAATLLEGSALTSPAIAVPHGHYAEESMKKTVVPNRNAVMLAMAYAAAVSRQAEMVACAAHSGDHPIYPDCRPEFIAAFEQMEHLATAGMVEKPIRLYAPFLQLTKAEIVGLGHQMNIPWDLTWSCYEGGAAHCGKCGTCVERREAFEVAGVPDPTVYAEAVPA